MIVCACMAGLAIDGYLACRRILDDSSMTSTSVSAPIPRNEMDSNILHVQTDLITR
jgi:hypothetical protein